LRLYLDTSVLISLFVEEVGTPVARAGIAGNIPVVSEYAAGEFYEGIARRARAEEITPSMAQQLFESLEIWLAHSIERIDVTSTEVPEAAALVRRLDLGLRMSDALHIALAGRSGATLFTFDQRLAAAALALGLTVETGAPRKV
jgi:hypothetical protein